MLTSRERPRPTVRKTIPPTPLILPAAQPVLLKSSMLSFGSPHWNQSSHILIMFRQSETITNYLHIQPLCTFWHRDRFPQVLNNVSLPHCIETSMQVHCYCYVLVPCSIDARFTFPRNTVQFNGFIFGMIESLIHSIRKWQQNFNQAHFGTCATSKHKHKQTLWNNWFQLHIS